MSKTLDLILTNKKGYIAENYGEEKEIFPIKYLLEKEMVELGNVDIPIYLSEQSLIELNKYNLSNEKLTKIVNREYTRWLNANRLNHDPENLELFKEDCYFRNIQNNSFEILDEIKEVISDYLSENINNIKGFWLTSEEIAKKKIDKSIEIPLPVEKNYICISDMNEEGILIAFK